MKPKLKYLFLAEFENGKMIFQDEKDLSSIQANKSAFFDVLNNESKLVKFSLLEEKMVAVSLDLRTGVFNIGGYEFEVGDNEVKGDRVLIYGRNRVETIGFKEGKEEQLVSEITGYVLGFEADEKKHFIVIK